MNYSEVMTVIGDNKYLSQFIKTNLELIKTVNDNYKHISELNCLDSLYSYSEFDDSRNIVMNFLRTVVQNTRANHYDREVYIDVDVILKQIK